MNWTEEDIEKREEQYREQLSKPELLQNAARKVQGVEVRQDGFIEHVGNEKLLNPAAFKYRDMAEMKEMHGIDPEMYVHQVIEYALLSS